MTIEKIPWVLVIGGLLTLVVLRYPLNGTFRVETDFHTQSPWINSFLPAQRVASSTHITGDPVYLNVRVPGPYKRVTVDIDYTTKNQPTTLFGIVHDIEGKQLELQPLEHKPLVFTIDERWNTIRFVLGAPGIATRGGSVDVSHVTITFHRPTATFSDWLHIFKQEVSNALHRL
jgi:hypothetical protein